MAGALNVLVLCLGVIPVVNKRDLFIPGRCRGDALLAPCRHGVSVVVSSPCLLGLCVLCTQGAELLPQKKALL